MIVVSHRGPFGFSVGDDGALDANRGPGGLAGTLHLLATSSDALREATCISAALGDGDRRAMASPELDRLQSTLGTDVRFVALDAAQHRLHYEVVSNEILWFLFHGIFDLPRAPAFGPEFRDAWDAFVAVNETFAAATADAASDGEIVLVQDYPLVLVPGLLADRRPDLRVSYFAHTPFCGPDGIAVLPDDAAAAVCRSMGARPSGFHTTRWARAFEDSARVVLGGDGRVAPAFAAPLGPDPEGLATIAASAAVQEAAAELDELVGDRKLVFRSDRIDLTKNIVRSFEAYDIFLAEHPEWRERVVFVAMLTSSRETVPEYIAYRKDVEESAARVNERWTTPSWQPLVVDTRDDFEQTVAGFRRYDVLVVNPVKDGLNLVAKEGPLVNTRDGVLCLSPEAGAFAELGHAALAVHPYDVGQNAAALHRALTMDDAERRTRAEQLRTAAGARTPQTWLRDLVAHAR